MSWLEALTGAVVSSTTATSSSILMVLCIVGGFSLTYSMVRHHRVTPSMILWLSWLIHAGTFYMVAFWLRVQGVRPGDDFWAVVLTTWGNALRYHVLVNLAVTWWYEWRHRGPG